jgi:DNA-binding NtrC family response regulator
MDLGDRTEDTQPRITRPEAPGAAPRTAVLVWSGAADLDGAAAGQRIWELRGALEIGRNPRALPGATRVRLPDGSVSRSHARILRTRSGGYVVEDTGSLNGTFVDGRRVTGEHPLASGSVLAVGNNVLVFRLCTTDDLGALEEQLRDPFGPTPTLSPAVATLRRELRRLARSSLDLLFVGETGVGKEVYAEALHVASGRPGPFVAINCATLPDNLLESELYGYARGAHSTATHDKRGLAERANGGTLFLDEIGEMPASAQAKLLRFLQTRSFTPLGATRSLRLDVRVLAATNRPLGPDSPLRADLVARFGSNPIAIPPLRERIEDVGPLAAHLAGGRDHACAGAFAPDAYHSLFLYGWPGNVRELETVVTMARLLAGESPVDLSKLPALFRHALAAGQRDDLTPPGGRPSRPTPTPAELVRLLEAHAGDVATVARKLGRQRTLVWRWLRKGGVDPRPYRISKDT